MRIARLAAVAVLPATILAVAACTDGGVRAVDGTAGPVTGASSSSAAPPAATSAAANAPTSAPTTPPATAATGTVPARSTPARLVLGPKGYGALKLGMSREAASATGLIDSWKTSGTSGCIGYTHLKANTGDEGSVLYSTATGIVVIDAPSNAVRTPEGIHIGSSVAAVLKAYPDWEPAEADGPGADGRGWAPVPGNRDAYYRMMIQGGKVTDLTLQHKNQDCYE